MRNVLHRPGSATREALDQPELPSDPLALAETIDLAFVSSNDIISRRFFANDIELNVRVLGPADGPPLVMLHGMHDVALNLLPVAHPLAERFRIYLPCLRGHGASDWSSVYSFAAFVFDLRRCLDELGLKRPLLFGHSLGGQILTRFAAMYPERVKALVLAEGLGPPRPPMPADSLRSIRLEGERIVASMAATPRTLPSVEFAAKRLRSNNPRIAPEQAERLVRNMTRASSDGRLRWAFDPRVPVIFARPEDAYRYWPHVRAPTLVVAGTLSHEYWAKLYPEVPQWTGRFADGELEARVRSFHDAELASLDLSGHMLHWDQPSALARLSAEFFEARALG